MPLPFVQKHKVVVEFEAAKMPKQSAPNPLDDRQKKQILRETTVNPFNSMKSSFLRLLPMCGFLAAATVFADDADLLKGKWLTKKTDDSGQSHTQTIEITKDKFNFQVNGADNEAMFYATGDVKLQKLGPFNSIRFLNIRGGSSAANLDDVNDEFVCIYKLDEDTWTVASNFDKDRQAKPAADVYLRVKADASARTLVIDEIEMADTPQAATWFICFEATVNGEKRRHYDENKGYEKNQVKIPLNLEVPKVAAGQKCSFKVQLDDVDEDTCTDDVDNRSTGEFVASEKGSQNYKPENNWQYTIRWHLK
jgi:hypothetical protein